jgi:hypothetical protein
MRLPRILAEGEGYYHVMSRIIGCQMLLDDGEKERLIRTMRKCEAFSGCNVLGHTCMDNHFLCGVGRPCPLFSLCFSFFVRHLPPFTAHNSVV